MVSHVQLLIRKNPSVFADAYKHFFCRYNDPICVKEIKVKCLASLANDGNAQDILSELSEVAVEVESAMEQAIYHLLTFLDMQQDYIMCETSVCIKILLRKYQGEDSLVSQIGIVQKAQLLDNLKIIKSVRRLALCCWCGLFCDGVVGHPLRLLCVKI